jgi:hypothetical protein
MRRLQRQFVFRLAMHSLAVVALITIAGMPLPADDKPGLVPAGAVFVPSATVLTYVEQPAVRDELQLTPVQQARIVALRAELQAADAGARDNDAKVVVDKAIARSIDAVVLLNEILTPAQVRRHNQIIMQRLLIRFGLVQLVQAIDAADALGLDAEQQQQLQAVLRTAGYGAPERGIPDQPANQRVRRGPAFPAPAANPPEGAAPAGPGNLFAAIDRNGDGKLSEDEIPERLKATLAAADANHDKVIDKEEFQKGMAARRGSGSAGPAANPAVAGRRPDSRFRQRQILDEFTNPDLLALEPRPNAELFETANDQISALLTAAQKKHLLEFLGPPLAFRPSGSPPAVLGTGTQRFAFPRVTTRDAGKRSSRIRGTVLLHSPVIPALLAQPAVRDELKLSSEVVAQLPPFSGDPGDVPLIQKELVRLLQPAQVERLKQLALQSAERDSGLAPLFEFQEVVEAIPLSDRQYTALSALLLSDLRSTRRAVLAAIERNPDQRHKFDEGTAQRLEEILTREQRERLTGLLGEPFQGPLSTAAFARGIEPRLSLRGKVAPALGYLTSVPGNFYLNSPNIQQAVHSVDERRAASGDASQRRFPALPFRLTGSLSPQLWSGGPADDKQLKTLTPEQARRYTEIVLQGSIKSDGPAVVFRYRPVVDALSPSADQQRRLLEALWDDTGRYLETPRPELAAKLPELDKQAAAAIDAILSAEQREKLARFLGQPADGVDAAPIETTPARAESFRPPVSRRLAYPVRHGSAADLAEVVRQHFREAGDVHAEAAPADNVLLVAAPPALFDDVRATLPRLDRPRQTVIVDVLLVESPSLRESDRAADEPRLSDRDLSGPIEQVTARLEVLLRQKKLIGLRRIRLETLEDQTGTFEAGREVMAITAANLTRTGFWIPILRSRSVGTAVNVTPRVTPANQVALDLELQDARLETPEDADELGLGPNGPLIAQDARLARLTSALTVPIGEAAVVEGLQYDGKDQSQELRVIVAVRLAGNTSP